MIRTLKDTGADYPISSNIDGSVYAIATQDCVIGGMGNEFSVTTSTSSLSLTFTKGSVAVLCGNAFWLEKDETVALPANSTFNLCARIDTSKPNGQTGSFECLTEAGMKNNNINNGGIRDLILYTITTSANGVTTCVDKRTIITTTTYATKDYVNEKNNTAVSKADNAQSTANTAVSKADNAQSTANSAVNSASGAQGTANTAVSKANSAQGTADSALSKANSALSRQNISMSLNGDTLYINF